MIKRICLWLSQPRVVLSINLILIVRLGMGVLLTFLLFGVLFISYLFKIYNLLLFKITWPEVIAAMVIITMIERSFNQSHSLDVSPRLSPESSDESSLATSPQRHRLPQSMKIVHEIMYKVEVLYVLCVLLMGRQRNQVRPSRPGAGGGGGTRSLPAAFILHDVYIWGI